MSGQINSLSRVGFGHPRIHRNASRVRMGIRRSQGMRQFQRARVDSRICQRFPHVLSSLVDMRRGSLLRIQTVGAGMEAVKHDVTHFFQTAEVNCGYTALAMQLSHYGSGLTPQEIYQSAPRAVVDGVQLAGGLATQCRIWVLGL